MNQEDIIHQYLTGNESKKKLVLVIGPDKGLCGSLVSNLSRMFFEEDHRNDSIITVGKKMERALYPVTSQFVANFPMGTNLPAYSSVYPIIKVIDDLYMNGKIGTVEVFYTNFVNLFTQTPVHEQILPIALEKIDGEDLKNLPYLFEPNIKTILERLLPYYLEVVLYNRIIEAFTSEQAARMIAMQNAKNNANDIADFLTLSYNKSRQERITNELLDLTNGQIV